MGYGDSFSWESGEDTVRRRHLWIVALQELQRARGNLERAVEACAGDGESVARLVQIEDELAVLRSSTKTLSRRRRKRAELDLLLAERLVLEHLGFESYTDYANWVDQTHGTSAGSGGESDAAYAEFAAVEVERARERLAQIEDDEVDLLSLEEGRGEPNDLTYSAPGPELDPWLHPLAAELEARTSEEVVAQESKSLWDLLTTSLRGSPADPPSWAAAMDRKPASLLDVYGDHLRGRPTAVPEPSGDGRSPGQGGDTESLRIVSDWTTAVRGA